MSYIYMIGIRYLLKSIRFGPNIISGIYMGPNRIVSRDMVYHNICHGTYMYGMTSPPVYFCNRVYLQTADEHSTLCYPPRAVYRESGAGGSKNIDKKYITM